MDFTEYFLNKNGLSLRQAVPVSGDASTRKYFRIYENDRSFILQVSDAGTVKDFLETGKFFAAGGINVPEILDADEEHGLVLQQDLGSISLEQYIISLPEPDIVSIYKKACDIIFAIQELDPSGTVIAGRSFDMEKLMFEFDFFIQHCLLEYMRLTLSDSELNELRQKFSAVAYALQIPESFAVTHRDYHSRNIMITGNGPAVIDFQDARMGLPYYDMVSLIEDPYTDLNREIRSVLRDYCYHRMHHAVQADEFRHLCGLSAFQRCIKAMGTYGFQEYVLHKKGYSRWIPAAASAAAEAAETGPETAAAWKLLRGFFL